MGGVLRTGDDGPGDGGGVGDRAARGNRPERDRFAGLPINATGKLAIGVPVDGPIALRNALVADPATRTTRLFRFDQPDTMDNSAPLAKPWVVDVATPGLALVMAVTFLVAP